MDKMMPDFDDAGVLLANRKKEIALRDEMLAFQKDCEKRGDRDGARFFREEAAEHMKLYRALQLLIPWYVANPPGDCRRVVARSDWPLELLPKIRYWLGLVSFQGAP